MRVLLDTHTFLWFVLGEAQLSSTATSHILNPVNTKLVSPASYLHEPYEAFMQRGIFGNGFRILPIEPQHTAVLTTLPLHHRDPFDRLLIAQAMVEHMPIISDDSLFDAYPIMRLW